MEAVDAFSRALGLSPDGSVPPTYAAVYALGTTAPQLFSDPLAEVDLGRLLHASQEFEWSRHPTIGERVEARARVASDITRRGARFISLETEVRGAERNDPVCVSRALFVIRGSDA
ncbi:MAG TPA: MaoC family dehydratase N-terminal domain-containing protein [Candidatus Acidoferrales bacterium]|nr:MaoC family dehydratase N-terminal domain-containing protein [Candidatus Acidoferrales bacterium]